MYKTLSSVKQLCVAYVGWCAVHTSLTTDMLLRIASSSAGATWKPVDTHTPITSRYITHTMQIYKDCPKSAPLYLISSLHLHNESTIHTHETHQSINRLDNQSVVTITVKVFNIAVKWLTCRWSRATHPRRTWRCLLCAWIRLSG